MVSTRLPAGILIPQIMLILKTFTCFVTPADGTVKEGNNARGWACPSVITADKSHFWAHGRCLVVVFIARGHVNLCITTSLHFPSEILHRKWYICVLLVLKLFLGWMYQISSGIIWGIYHWVKISFCGEEDKHILEITEIRSIHYSHPFINYIKLMLQ